MLNPMTKKPILGISMGDPAGIGPEIILKSLSGQRSFTPLLLGQKSVFTFYNNLCSTAHSFYSVNDVSEITESDDIPVLDISHDNTTFTPTPGTPTSEGAALAMEAVKTGALLAIQNKTDALVTAPISKYWINQAGYHFKGHTDYLANITNTQDYAMMLIGHNLKVILVTIHIPFSSIIESLSVDTIFSTIRMAHKGIQQFGIKNPRIAVCALNPHAGEEGLLGDEEIRIIRPAVERALNQNITVTGIFPPDTVFWDAVHGKADVVVAMYHDQGLIPIKVLAFDKGVNVTIGLPIIRSSPDHGTAFGIAGKNCANPASMEEAVKTAQLLIRHRTS